MCNSCIRRNQPDIAHKTNKGLFGDFILNHCWFGCGLVGNIIHGPVSGLVGGWFATSLLHIGASMNGINLGLILVALVGRWKAKYLTQRPVLRGTYW